MASQKSEEKIAVKILAAHRKRIAKRLPDWTTRLSLTGDARRKIALGARAFAEFRRDVDAVIRTLPNGRERQEWREIDQELCDANGDRGELLPPDGVVFQLRIDLVGAARPIWRRVQIPARSVDRLHEQIQCAMGWTNSHLHQFFAGAARYGDPLLLNEDDRELEAEEGLVDSTRASVEDLFDVSGRKRKPRAEYEYDFGDGWVHEVTLEKRLSPDPERRYPICLEGENACPPEDCGGVYGYEDMLAALADSEHEEHETFSAWIGASFDPTAFDVEATTRAMRLGFPHWTSLSWDL